MSIYQNLKNDWNESLERSLLEKYRLSKSYVNIIAFRSMLEQGENSFEALQDQINFIKLFPIYMFNTQDYQQAIESPLDYWNSSYEYDMCIPLHTHNFYKIMDHLYYIDY